MDLIDSLVKYVNDIKPYHSKIYGVEVEYKAFDDINLNITDNLNMEIFIGVPFRDDLNTYRWGIDGFPHNDGPNFTPLGGAYFDQFFKIGRGWDSIPFDDYDKWDKGMVFGEPDLTGTGILHDNVIVHFSESLSINYQPYVKPIEVCIPPVMVP